jgi:uncharacterized membrane protein
MLVKRNGMEIQRIIKTFIAMILLSSVMSCAIASDNERTCQGNLETFDKQIIKADVTYKLSYGISGSKVKVHFAGREFDANAESGKTWKGLWITRIDESIYFSYLPDEGGTMKFQFEPNLWYSGNC